MATAGKNAVFKVGSTAIVGMNDGSVKVNGETIDVTTFASGGWVQKIQGLKSAEISLSGFFEPTDTTGQVTLRTALLNGTSQAITALMDGTVGWTGNFLVTGFETGASSSSEVSVSISLESTGAISVV